MLIKTAKQNKEARTSHELESSDHNLTDTRALGVLASPAGTTCQASSRQYERLRAKVAALEVENKELRTKYTTLHSSACEKLSRVTEQNVLVSNKLQCYKQENTNLKRALQASNSDCHGIKQVLGDQIQTNGKKV